MFRCLTIAESRVTVLSVNCIYPPPPQTHTSHTSLLLRLCPFCAGDSVAVGLLFIVSPSVRGPWSTLNRSSHHTSFAPVQKVKIALKKK